MLVSIKTHVEESGVVSFSCKISGGSSDLNFFALLCFDFAHHCTFPPEKFLSNIIDGKQIVTCGIVTPAVQ